MSETSEESQAKLHQAILNVKKRVPYIQKTYAEGLRYSAMMSEKLIEKISDVLVEEGLTIHPFAIEAVHVGHYQTTNGKVMQSRIYKIGYRFTHEAGGSRDVWSVGEADDVGDKASSKAQTIARKYAIAHAFLIETGNDPDKVSSAKQERSTDESEAKKLEVKFKIAVNSMRSADGKDIADLISQTAKKRGFTKEQLEQLDAIKTSRYAGLPDKSPTAGKAKK